MRFRLSRPAIVLLVVVVFAALWVYSSQQDSSPAPAPPNPTTAPRPRPTSVVLATLAPAPPVTSAPPARPPTQAAERANRNLLLGNPSGAASDPAQPDNYLIERPQYVLSYNRDHGTPNWVSWQVTPRDLGSVQRSNEFESDSSLPDGWYRATLEDYTDSGYDRGHLCPSGDRTATVKDNRATFILTNILPQAPENNRSTWEHLESFARTLVREGHVLYQIAGGDGANGTIARGRVLVPRYTWKIVVVMPKGATGIKDITADTPVIAVRVPNSPTDKLGDWEKYRVTVASIEAATGYHFFTALSPATQRALKAHVSPVPAAGN